MQLVRVLERHLSSSHNLFRVQRKCTFQNLLLLERVMCGLESEGFSVDRHRRVPANDGGISLGQAMVAGAVLRGA